MNWEKYIYKILLRSTLKWYKTIFNVSEWNFIVTWMCTSLHCVCSFVTVISTSNLEGMKQNKVRNWREENVLTKRTFKSLCGPLCLSSRSLIFCDFGWEKLLQYHMAGAF